MTAPEFTPAPATTARVLTIKDGTHDVLVEDVDGQVFTLGEGFHHLADADRAAQSWDLTLPQSDRHQPAVVIADLEVREGRVWVVVTVDGGRGGRTSVAVPLSDWGAVQEAVRDATK